MSKIMTIKYTNSDGTTLILNQGSYLVSDHDFRNFAWNYVATNRPSGYGGRVSFNRPVQEKIINIGIRGSSAEEFELNAAALHALTEVDILNSSPGRLYLGDQYLTCYLSTSSKVNYHSRRGNWVSKELVIVVTEPFWHTENNIRFLMGAPAEVVGGKRYPNRYAYRYISSTSSGTIINPHYAPAPMIITIYDAAINPSITIGGKVYALNITIADGQRIIINQLDRTIISLTSTGTVQNLFDYRSKINDIFEYIQPGTQPVIYTGDFTFDVTIITQRSEASWT